MNRILLFVFMLILIAPSKSLAAGAFVPIIDVPQGAGIVNGATLGMVGKADRAYLCVLRIDGTKSDVSASIQSPSGAMLTGVRPSSTGDAQRYLSSTGVTLDPADDVSLDNVILFTSPSGTSEFGKYTLTIGITSGTPTSVFVSCTDSTIICEINTFLGQSVFVEVNNLGPITGAAQLRVVDSNGNNTLVPGQLSFPPGVRRDVAVNSGAGSNLYGYVIIQPLNFSPQFDSFSDTKVSTYSNGAPVSTVSCESGFGIGRV